MRVFSLSSLTLLSALHSAAFATELLDRSEGLHSRSNVHGRRDAQEAASTGPTVPLSTGSANPSGMPNAASKNVDSGRRLPHFTYDQLYNLQIKFLDSFIFPNNQKEVGLPPRVTDG